MKVAKITTKKEITWTCPVCKEATITSPVSLMKESLEMGGRCSDCEVAANPSIASFEKWESNK